MTPKPVSDSVPIRIGTSAFTAAGWPEAFYPAGLKPADYLSYYATQFNTVEVDSTFYATPRASMVRGWYEKTPANFLFAAKVPQAITHELVLKDCEAEFKQFLTAMEILGEKLGPLLLQFPYFNRKAFPGVQEFLARLVPFLKKLPADFRFAVEIRNKNWLVPALIEALRERGVALALIDQSWMPRPHEWFKRIDPVTGGFAYIRWLGDRKGIEERTKVWDRLIIDREPELREWADICRVLNQRGLPIFAYANNHYAGFGPGTVRLFEELLKRK